MEIEYRGPEDRQVDLWIEPWGDRLEVAPGSQLRLTFEGEIVESLVLEWTESGLWAGLPRHSVLRVLSQTGAMLREYDTRTLPPTPPGTRPI
jgi:hypothetical protein